MKSKSNENILKTQHISFKNITVVPNVSYRSTQNQGQNFMLIKIVGIEKVLTAEITSKRDFHGYAR